jgi:hypothetical protein
MTDVMPYVPDGDVLTDFFWDRSRLAIIQGPIQSGTSTCCCHKIWVLACEQEPDFDGVRRSKWIVTRDTYKDLRETTIPTWLTWFAESMWGPMIHAEPAYHQMRNYRGGKWDLIPHPSGDGTRVDCEVIFLALPDPSVAEKVLASFEITGFFRNEGQFCEKSVIDELLSRCARFPSKRNGPGATWYGGFIDLNAPREGHWIPYMRGDLSMPVEWSEEHKEQFAKPDNWKFFMQPPGLIEKVVDKKIVYLPNPKAENQKHTTQSYMELIVGKAKKWIDQRVLNKTGLYVDGQAVYPTFTESEHVAPRKLEARAGAQIIVGLDFGRQPAAVFGQNINGCWTFLSELAGENESAELFAPKVKRHLADRYPGFNAIFWGDPRGADPGQNVETTAYDIFAAKGMMVRPATTDNNVEMRRSAMEAVLERRLGLQVNPSCMMIKVGLAGGYHYPPIKGTGLFRDQPKKNVYSHIIEAMENAILGGGEGYAIIRPAGKPNPGPSKVRRHKVNLRRTA